jgi:glycosyltransferase involved in cell wall biosynthesis
MPQKNSFNIKLLSIVMPAYKQEKTIAADIANIAITLDELNYNYEIVVVVDGMLDNTYKNAVKHKSKRIKVFGYEKNQGKGHAIRFGMLHANGDIIGFIDAGMDIHPAGLKMLLSHMEWYNADIIVGSKLHPVSKVDYPFYRTVLSWGYRLLTRVLFGFQVRDTQVGLKFFKRKVVRDVVPRLEVNRFAFDIEILAVAYALGYKRIFEAPVEINFNNSSNIVSTKLWKIIASMILDTFRVYYKVRVIRLYTKKKNGMYNSDMNVLINAHK